MSSKNDQFFIRVWGARGSIPSPGPKTVKYGGNTSCLEVRCGNEIIILDAGTGIRSLGDLLLKEMPIHATILLSHAHWDHIQGFPFFTPVFLDGNSFDIYGETKIDIEETLRLQMMYPTFPVTLDELQSTIHFHDIKLHGHIQVKDVKINYDSLNHPGGVTGYKIEYKGKSIVYATDTEHFRCVDQTLLKLAKDCDILFYDATYTDDEYSGKVGFPKTTWGHSTWEAGVEIAQAANVKKLILWHHEPSHEDSLIDEIEQNAQKIFKETYAAYEGMVISLL